MFADEAHGVLVADSNRCRTLETLIGVEKIEPVYPLSSIRKHSIIRSLEKDFFPPSL
jgi:hypothetical protein